MTQEQAQEALHEIRRLLAEREVKIKAVEAIDRKIQELVGVEDSRRPTERTPLSKSDARRLSGVA